MCTFITLIAATDDVDRLNTALATLDRRGQVRRAVREAAEVLASMGDAVIHDFEIGEPLR